MSFYRFNLEDHHFIASRGWFECDDELDAQALANELAEHLGQARPELLEGGHGIVVRDRQHRQIYRAAMDRASIARRRH
jgi:Domain of unknown function (DUF6894)